MKLMSPSVYLLVVKVHFKMAFHSHVKEEALLFSLWECTAANHNP